MLAKYQFICLILALAFSMPGHSVISDSQKLTTLFAEEWQARLDRSPLMATGSGDSSKNHLLDDVSEKAQLAWLFQTKQFVEVLRGIDKQQLTSEELINYQIFEAQLLRRISELNFKSYQIPFLSDSGFHTQIMRLPDQVPLNNKADYQNYISRLEQIPVYFQQQINNMKAGIKRGFTMPKVVMRGFSEVILKAYEGGGRNSRFWRPFNTMPKNISAEEQKELIESADKVLSKRVIPAFESLYTFFEQVYIPGSRDTIGASDLPDGMSYYDAQVSHYTTLSLSADEIHQIGLAEMARIRAEMEDIIKHLEYQGDFKSFLKYLRETPRFYAQSAEELIKEASYIAKKMDGQLAKLFTRLPRQPYTVEPVPEEIAPKYTTGRYLSAPLDSERTGVYWVNTYALNKRPLYVLEALTLHEAVPGHHLQNALNQELIELPEFRRNSYISAFGEGWGLYSERLGLEVGFYQDPYSNFGRLTYEMWRAARLVIDTGIHAKGWSRDKAIKLLENNSALSTHNIRTEVDRYISWPGQALSYKLGEIKIRALREKATGILGDKFNLRLFHDQILMNGSIPLKILEQQIDQFIDQQQKLNN